LLHLSILLGGLLLSDGLVLLPLDSDGLSSELASSPGLSKIGVVVERLSKEIGQSNEILSVLLLGSLESEASASLLVNHSSQSRLSLDDDVRDSHLSAKSGQPNDQLNRVNIVSDDDELGLLLLNGIRDLRKSIDEIGLLGGCNGLSLGLGLRSLEQSLSLSDLSLGLVLVEKSEQLSGGRLVSGSSELVDRGGDLQSVHQDTSLSLKLNVLGPSNESGKISLGLNRLSNTEVSISLLEERVLDGGLGSGLLDGSLLGVGSFLGHYE